MRTIFPSSSDGNKTIKCKEKEERRGRGAIIFIQSTVRYVYITFSHTTTKQSRTIII